MRIGQELRDQLDDALEERVELHAVVAVLVMPRVPRAPQQLVAQVGALGVPNWIVPLPRTRSQQRFAVGISARHLEPLAADSENVFAGISFEVSKFQSFEVSKFQS